MDARLCSWLYLPKTAPESGMKIDDNKKASDLCRIQGIRQIQGDHNEFDETKRVGDAGNAFHFLGRFFL
jgi:hypothetical protein